MSSATVSCPESATAARRSANPGMPFLFGGSRHPTSSWFPLGAPGLSRRGREDGKQLVFLNTTKALDADLTLLLLFCTSGQSTSTGKNADTLYSAIACYIEDFCHRGVCTQRLCMYTTTRTKEVQVYSKGHLYRLLRAGYCCHEHIVSRTRKSRLCITQRRKASSLVSTRSKTLPIQLHEI